MIHAKFKFKHFVMVLLILVIMFPQQSVADIGRAKTAPPPEFGMYTIFDPDFKYLDSGSGSLSDLGNGEVKVWGETLGAKMMDTIGVQVTLQRWTGSRWIDVNTGSKTTYDDSSYAYTSDEISVVSGYYYRVKSTHWIEYGGVKEEGTLYSSSILIG